MEDHEVGEVRLPGAGSDLGPVHRSIGPVEMLPHVQKLYKTRHMAAFQRVLDPSLFPRGVIWIRKVKDNKPF